MQKPSDEMGVRVLQEQEQTKEQQKLLSEVLDGVFPEILAGQSVV